MLANVSSLVAVVIKGPILSKYQQNNSPVVCDGCVKYDKGEVDRLAIWKTNNYDILI